MELFLFESKEFEHLYGCKNIQIDHVPIEKRSHIAHGFICIALFVVFEIFYLPCMVSLYWHRDNACYKLLFYIGITDMLVLFMNSLETGLFGIFGSVFCSSPTLIYISGTFGLSLWYAETFCELILAINRCLELTWPHFAEPIFRGNRTWWLCLLPTVYALALSFFTKPILFSGIYFSWFFNPYVGYNDDFGQIYHSKWHSIHDYFVIFGLTTIYIIFSALIIFRTRTLQSNLVQTSFAQKMTFLQVVIISAFNAICSGIYIYMQLFRIDDWLIFLGTYTWIFAHGFPPLIYLCLNATIRKDFLAILCKSLKMMGIGKKNGAPNFVTPISVQCPVIQITRELKNGII